MKSVSESMRWLAIGDGRRFPSVEEAWGRFLDYLRARNGVDLCGRKSADRAEIDALLQYVEDLIEEPTIHRGDGVAARLEAFGQREDVIDAFKRFCKEEMLPSP